MANHCDIKNSFFFYLISRHHQHVIFRQALGHTQENTFTHSHIQPLAKAPALIKHSCHLFTRKKDCQISLSEVGPCFSLC